MPGHRWSYPRRLGVGGGVAWTSNPPRGVLLLASSDSFRCPYVELYRIGMPMLIFITDKSE
jgi:hypothetical protein